jgi:hypothetical protein
MTIRTDTAMNAVTDLAREYGTTDDGGTLRELCALGDPWQLNDGSRLFVTVARASDGVGVLQGVAEVSHHRGGAELAWWTISVSGNVTGPGFS